MLGGNPSVQGENDCAQRCPGQPLLKIGTTSLLGNIANCCGTVPLQNSVEILKLVTGSITWLSEFIFKLFTHHNKMVLLLETPIYCVLMIVGGQLLRLSEFK